MKSKFFALLGILGFFATACSDVNLIGPKAPLTNAQSVGEFCTYNPDKKDVKTNILFVIDYSGSNADTDPQKIRVQKMMDFYNQNKDPNVYRWSFISFDSDAVARLNDGDDQTAIFTEDDARIQSTLSVLQGMGPNSGTDYEVSLNMTQHSIENDIQLHPERDDYYLIIFMSDGQPNEGSVRNESAARAAVSRIVGIKPGKIFLSAAYYGGTNTTASNIIAGMADAGGGKYANFDHSEDIKFDDLIVGHTVISWILKNDSFIVYNLNSALCQDGSYGVDSDGDFLCDRDEIALGNDVNGNPISDPTKRSTPQLDLTTNTYTDRGFADYFLNRERLGDVALNPFVCKPTDRIDEDNDLLLNCEEDLLKNQNPSGTEYPPGVIRYTADRLDPDTDNDGVIDGLEVAAFSASHWGWALDNFINKDYDKEGISAFQQIQEHRNPLMIDMKAPSYDVNISQLPPPGTGQSCFAYSQSRLQLYQTLPVDPANVHPMLRHPDGAKGGYNVVLVYFMQNRFNDPNGKGIYMYSTQALKNDARYQASQGSAAGLKVRDGEFTPYLTYEKLEQRARAP